MAQQVEVMPDGWIVTDLRVFRALTDHAPPRPWGYWEQIRSDRHEPILVRKRARRRRLGFVDISIKC